MSNRSKRLRKKLYLDEFSIYGFEFKCTLSCSNEEELDTFIDEIVSYIESRNLNIGGGGDLSSFGGFISSKDRYGSAKVEDIKNLKTWLSSHQSVSDVNVGQLVDAMYGI